MIDTLLAVAILFAPFFALCALTVVVEGSHRIGNWFDQVNDKADARIARSLERMLR